ncbi:hypothetical protein [Actinophytocola sp.]|uniref:hypothetical protein n=1 Tax=Actinophytocola sp. TaxID=1872138 RepID=UPI002D249B3D|nr:hypothetical protein [Actinophytocola sp.]HYQ67233.1 hypothetical protein [Actinophytocola sp.]
MHPLGVAATCGNGESDTSTIFDVHRGTGMTCGHHAAAVNAEPVGSALAADVAVSLKTSGFTIMSAGS